MQYSTTVNNARLDAVETAIGTAPEVIQEPFTIVLWGVTNKSLADWAAVQEVKDPDSITELKGFAGSPGIREGKARVCRTVDEVGELCFPESVLEFATRFGKAGGQSAQFGGVGRDALARRKTVAFHCVIPAKRDNPPL